MGLRELGMFYIEVEMKSILLQGLPHELITAAET